MFRLSATVVGALTLRRETEVIASKDPTPRLRLPPRQEDHFEMCGTTDAPLCPPMIFNSFPSIMLHHEEHLQSVRTFDKVPYLSVLLYTTFRGGEDVLCSESGEGPFAPDRPRVVEYDGEPRFEIIEPTNFDDFPKFVADYAAHVTEDQASLLPRFYFVFTSAKCRNRLFVLRNIQLPVADAHTTITRITGMSRNTQGWIQHDDWARNEMSVDLQSKLVGEKLAQYDNLRQTILYDLKHFIGTQANGTLVGFNLRVSQSEWVVPLCDPTGENGRKCVMPLEIRRHSLWPVGFIGDNHNKTREDFIEYDSTLALETEHLTDEFTFLRRKMCNWVKDDLRRSPHDQSSNNCVASVQPIGTKTTVEYDMTPEGNIDDVVIWDISTRPDTSMTSFNFSTYSINAHDLANLQSLPDAGIYRVHSVKNHSKTYHRGVRPDWRVLAIDGKKLINAKLAEPADVSHPFNFEAIRSIEPTMAKEKRSKMTITYENPDVVQNPGALTVKMYCFSFDNVMFNRTQDGGKLPDFCFKFPCNGRLHKTTKKCNVCYPKDVENHLTSLTKSIAQAMPNHFDNILLPVQLQPSEEECKSWLQHT